jgi:uncharacterized membrane protein YsdA (DUF1294 family)
MIWIYVGVAVVAVNCATLLCFWFDKRRAQAGEWRIRGSDQLLLAFLGGSPAALLGRQIFRHKTRKEPFSTLLQLIVVVQVGATVGFTIIS